MHGVGPVGEAERPDLRPHAREREILADARAAVHLHGLIDHFERDARRGAAWREQDVRPALLPLSSCCCVIASVCHVGLTSRELLSNDVCLCLSLREPHQWRCSG